MRAQDILADDTNEVEARGVRVRKGSVGAFLSNARAFHDPAVTGEARAQVLRDLEEGAAALRALGLFDVLEIRDPALREFMERAA